MCGTVKELLFYRENRPSASERDPKAVYRSTGRHSVSGEMITDPGCILSLLFVPTYHCERWRVPNRGGKNERLESDQAGSRRDHRRTARSRVLVKNVTGYP